MQVRVRQIPLLHVAVVTAVTALALLAGCIPPASRAQRASRSGDVALHMFSQSCVQGEIIPCG